MHKPLVSIVMSTYNDASFLKKSIDSVLSQTFQDWEFIIINDASQDRTGEILKQYQKRDKRIIYLKNKENLGLTKNLNKGIEIAEGDFIARLDGDDYWTDERKLQWQADFLVDNPSYGIIGTSAYAIDMSDIRLFEIEYPSEDREIRKIMLRHGPFVHSSVLIRKETLIMIGKYNEEHNFSEDYDLYLNLGRISKFHNIPEFMVNYRINPLGISRTKYLTQHKEVIKIILKHRKSYPGFLPGFVMWNLRSLYPVWFRGALSRQVKKLIQFQNPGKYN